MRSILTSATFFLALGSASLVQAQLLPPLPPPLPLCVPLPMSISGNTAEGTINILGIGADVTIGFESVVELTSANLNVSVCVINPLDPAYTSRLPALVTLNAAFPVVVRVRPRISSPLAFTGIYSFSFHTHALTLDLALPLSLLKAHDGAAFSDITNSEGVGSYRDDGSGGDFSEFLIGLDLRPIDSVITGKFAALEQLLDDNAASIPDPVEDELRALLAQALASYQSGDINQAISQVAAFADVVLVHSGPEIPDVWQASSPGVVNVAGRLRSAANTLRFSLERKGP
jgi:hypothetical protein